MFTKKKLKGLVLMGCANFKIERKRKEVKKKKWSLTLEKHRRHQYADVCKFFSNNI